MKPQDTIFFIIFVLVFFKKDPRIAAVFGLLCIIIAIPLFALWIFFTAQRLIWYAALLIFLSIVFYLLENKQHGS